MEKIKIGMAIGVFAMIFLFVTSCAGPSSKGMIPAMGDLSSSSNGQSLKIANVEGGRAPTFGGMETLRDETFRQAILDTLDKTALFSQVSHHIDGDYNFYAEITSQDTITDRALTYTAHLVVNYKILKDSNNEEVWQKIIRSRCAVTVSEAFSGATRMTKAIECATRENLHEMVREISTVKFR